MIKNSLINKLNNLSVFHLNCTLDDNEPNYIPPDLKEGTYRWILYIYSNLYTREKDYINPTDKLFLIEIFKILKDEHTISWTRDKLIELDREKEEELRLCIENNIKLTSSFFKLKVNLYLLRCFEKDWYYADPFILDISKNLKGFVKNE
jgi:hypothetical protein